jgi:ketosteroid isomerase-like protein
MRRYVLGAALALLALPVLAQEGTSAVDARWEKAMRAGDAAAAAACYSNDAFMWFPDAPEAHGKDAILKSYQGFFAAFKVLDVALTGAGSQTSGDLSGGWGHYMLKLQPTKGGDPVVLKGRYAVVARKIGGQWVYVADHASNEPAAAAPATPATAK